MKKIAGWLGVFFLLPSMAWAVSAELIVSPTRMVLTDRDRYATVSVKNPGDAIGRYRAEMVDAVMLEDGAVKMLGNGEKHDYSALNMIRVSPRSMTLRPGEYQTVRMLIKRPANLAEGEYRSHLKVRMTETNIDEKTGKPAAVEEGISIRPKLVMVIPVIIRHGKTDFATKITNVILKQPDKNNPHKRVGVTLTLEGNQSAIGDFVLIHKTGNAEKELTTYSGIAVYRGTPQRSIDIPLEALPQGGSLRVEYRGQNVGADGKLPVYASHELAL